MADDWVTIEILNWEKHNPKRDQKTYTWLRLSNDITTDQDLYGLSAEQKFVWIALLCQASKTNSATIRVNLAFLEQTTGVKKTRILNLLSFLQFKPTIRVHDTKLPPNVAECSEHDNALHLRTYERTDEHPHFDFEEIWKKYPRKVDKTDAKARFEKLIKNQSDLDGLSEAIDRYRKYCSDQKTEGRHIKHFATFLGTEQLPRWRDWLDPEAGKTKLGSVEPLRVKSMEDL